MRYTSVYSMLGRIYQMERIIKLYGSDDMSDQWRANTAARIAELDGGDRHMVRQLYRQLKQEVRDLQDEDLKRRIIEETAPYREEENRNIKAALRVLYLICLDDDVRAMVRDDSVARARDPNA